jgi:hypothetical protein
MKWYEVPASNKTPDMLLIESRRVGHHYTQTNTNNISKTSTILETTGGKDEPNIVFMQKS